MQIEVACLRAANCSRKTRTVLSTFLLQISTASAFDRVKILPLYWNQTCSCHFILFYQLQNLQEKLSFMDSNSCKVLRKLSIFLLLSSLLLSRCSPFACCALLRPVRFGQGSQTECSRRLGAHAAAHGRPLVLLHAREIFVRTEWNDRIQSLFGGDPRQIDGRLSCLGQLAALGQKISIRHQVFQDCSRFRTTETERGSRFCHLDLRCCRPTLSLGLKPFFDVRHEFILLQYLRFLGSLQLIGLLRRRFDCIVKTCKSFLQNIDRLLGFDGQIAAGPHSNPCESLVTPMYHIVL